MRSIDDIHLSQTDRRAIEEAKSLLMTHFPVEQIVLYGSKATGTDDEESDIDLLVLTPRRLSWRERSAIIDALFDIQLKHDVVLSPLILPSEDWVEGPFSVLPIHDEVEKFGVSA